MPADSPESSTPLLEVCGITRSFPGVLALDEVSLDLRAGEVHALVGENGAGKSTLINILSGVLTPDQGTIRLRGVPSKFNSPVECRQRGIVTVHQEADHFRDLSVAENMALFHGLPLTSWRTVNWRQVFGQARESVVRMGEPINVRRSAHELSIGQLHMTQVAAAVSQRVSVLILDEPTAALSDSESEWLFRQIDQLRQNGAAILYISHRQEEIFRLADRVTVLRDGRRVWHGAASETDRDRLIEAMVGRAVAAAPARSAEPPTPLGAVRLAVESLSDAAGGFREVDLTVRSGEIVGLYGLVGAGRSEFAQALFGRRPLAGGRVLVNGKAVHISSPRDAVRAGIAYVPEDRLRQALCRGLSIRANTVLASLGRWRRGPFMHAAAEQQAATDATQRLSVRHRSIEQSVGQLSGGNQQKVVLARWLLTEPSVLILDEPTRGVDVGAKDEIHSILAELAGRGCALLMISSELPEVMRYADRIVVFRRGRVSGEFEATTAVATEVAAAALPDDAEPTSESTGTAKQRRPAASQSRGQRRSLRSYFSTELSLALFVLVFASWTALTSEGFSLVTLMTNASLWGLLGLAAAVVIIGGGIDISIGSLVALSAAAAAIVLRKPGPVAVIVPAAIATGMFVGALGGALNAAISLVGRIHPIVVTLGTMTIYRGAVIALLGGKSVTGLPPEFIHLARDPATGFRSAALVAGLAIALVALWLNYTRAGRYVFAVGSGLGAARLAGVGKTRSWLIAFGLGGMLAGLAGVIQLAESGQMQSRLGVGWELHAIAVAVIGGVAITGGRGSVTGVVLGAILIRLINGALVRWGIRDVQFDLFVGGLILAAVLLGRRK